MLLFFLIYDIFEIKRNMGVKTVLSALYWELTIAKVYTYKHQTDKHAQIDLQNDSKSIDVIKSGLFRSPP